MVKGYVTFIPIGHPQLIIIIKLDVSGTPDTTVPVCVENQNKSKQFVPTAERAILPVSKVATSPGKLCKGKAEPCQRSNSNRKK